MSETASGLEIAVVGGGAAGVAAAHVLQRRHRVTLFERETYVGGHVNTVVLQDGPDAGLPVDTGFIVLNDRTYPVLHRLLAQLGVKVRDADMSFGFHCRKSGLQYAGTDFNGIFAQRGNLMRPSFLRMLADIARFGLRGREDLASGGASGRTLGEYLRRGGYSEACVRDYVVPMGAAIWSATAGDVMDFPAETFLRFFDNHGLLDLTDRPQWQTVAGGSHAYVKAFLKGFTGTVRAGEPVRAVRRLPDGVEVRLDSGALRFDRVVIAAHADQALALLADPSDEEKRLLGAWAYRNNRTVLHTDASALPPNRRAWASWNYARELSEGLVSATYHMNRLQGLTASREYCVTLNRREEPPEAHVVRAFDYEHPMYTTASVASQKELPGLNGKRFTYYCGSYFGFGFHEDAVRSGVAVANAFGLDL